MAHRYPPGYDPSQLEVSEDFETPPALAPAVELARLRLQRDHARTVAERCFAAWDEVATYVSGGAGVSYPQLPPSCDDGWDPAAPLAAWQRHHPDPPHGAEA